MVGPVTQTEQSPGLGDDAFRQLVDEHQRALRVHCYRMLGSLQDAEDQTQETLLRAWRNLQTFQGRASVRTWLYRIATNACLDELDRRGRRLLPPMLGAPTRAFVPVQQGSGEDTPWLEPVPDAWLEVADTSPGPEARYEAREAVELAFVSLLKDDAVLSMPPLAEWYVGPTAIGQFFSWATGPGGLGPYRLVPIRANGSIAFGVYGAGPAGPASSALLLTVLLADLDGIAAITSFMNPRLFPYFNLPLVSG